MPYIVLTGTNDNCCCSSQVQDEKRLLKTELVSDLYDYILVNFVEDDFKEDEEPFGVELIDIWKKDRIIYTEHCGSGCYKFHILISSDADFEFESGPEKRFGYVGTHIQFKKENSF